MPSDSIQRFSNRVDSYAKYRHNYPPEVLRCLQENMGLTPETVVADIGAGTGLLTERFLHNGNTVYAVEPNEGMRKAAEVALSQYPNLHSIAGRSEATSSRCASTTRFRAWSFRTPSSSDCSTRVAPQPTLAPRWRAS